MDLIKIVDTEIKRLPKGEYSNGLIAIQRHIGAAIRHFERQDDGTQDSFTDAIYRCNQAFEGGLKEAYRVLANKDPAKLTPHKIEAYIEKEKLIRPRALKQLTRYREDYRNPSTHDYKLDFDEDEAILAIVSVCAFTKLLVNQIATRIAFKSGAQVEKIEGSSEVNNSKDLRLLVARKTLHALNQTSIDLRGDTEELYSFLAGALSEEDFQIDFRNSDPDHNLNPETLDWSFVVRKDTFAVAIESRSIPDCDLELSHSFIEQQMGAEDIRDVVFVIAQRRNESEFEISELLADKGEITLISPKADVKKLASDRDWFDFSSICEKVHKSR